MTNLEKIREIVNGEDERKMSKLLLNLRNEFCVGTCRKKTKLCYVEDCENNFLCWLNKEWVGKSRFWKRFSD